MKRVGVLTYIHTNNYGAELQAFALHNKLRDMGYDATLVDLYRPMNREYVETGRFAPIFEFGDKRDRLQRINRAVYSVITKLVGCFFRRRRVVREGNFARFYDDYNHLSELTHYNFDSLYENEVESTYTHYIVGSDQVWSFVRPFSPEPYFLTFAKLRVKRISYAASIGHAVLPRGVTKLYEEWISKFDSVSMREREGVDIVTSLLGREVDLVLDPTLLFRRSEWLSRLNVEARSGRGYVLVYLLMSSPSSIGLAKRIAKQMGLEVKVLVPNYWSPYLFVTGCEFIYTAGPREFVELMEGAEFVVTNSFHGAAFAINFNIPFIATPRRSSRVLSRFNSLLELLELRERLVFDSVEFENLPSLEVDFGVANSTLERERERSLSYLRDALQ